MKNIENSFHEPIIAGPFSFYDGSFVVEFLKPDASRNASVMMRATYKFHPLLKKGKNHPQAPPLHVHFDQSETFQVISGKVGTTETYDLTDRTWTSADGPHEIKPWTPHKFWPVHDCTEDSTLLLWAHPDDTPAAMNPTFFHQLFAYTSDAYEGRATLNPFQIMLMQYDTDTAMVWFPTLSFLGPLRWWIPLQAMWAFATVARLLGYTRFLEKYTTVFNWERLQRRKEE